MNYACIAIEIELHVVYITHKGSRELSIEIIAGFSDDFGTLHSLNNGFQVRHSNFGRGRIGKRRNLVLCVRIGRLAAHAVWRTGAGCKLAIGNP